MINDIEVIGFDEKEYLYNVKINGRKEKVSSATIKTYIAKNIKILIEMSLIDTDLYYYGYIKDILKIVKHSYKFKRYEKE